MSSNNCWQGTLGRQFLQPDVLGRQFLQPYRPVGLVVAVPLPPAGKRRLANAQLQVNLADRHPAGDVELPQGRMTRTI
jgi:hypothetical protein